MTYDLLIIGSGFSGCLLGLTALARGRSVLVIDRQRHPRFAIGESSTPAADYVLESLCERFGWDRLRPLCRYGSWCGELPKVGRGIKRGFSYFHQRQHEPYRPAGDRSNLLLVTASVSDEVSDTHWLRADVDAWIARQFVAEGGVLREATAPEIACHEPLAAYPWSVRLQPVSDPSAATVLIRARDLVDGSGGDAGLRSAFQASADSMSSLMRTRSRAIFGHFEEVEPWQATLERSGHPITDFPFPSDRAALHQIIDSGWMWQLRFDHGVVSAGFALDERRWPVPTGMSPADEWHSWLGKYPSIAEQFRHARPVTPFTTSAPVIRTGRLQRLVDRAAGQGWAMLPNTAGFIDPFYSTGIAHSLLGVERLADRLIDGTDQLRQSYSDQLRAELVWIDQLVELAYRTFGRAPELLHAATMVYFAAATTWEKLRREGQDRAFLLADDTHLREAVSRLARAFPANDDPAAVRQWCHLAEKTIEPWNSVGLFHPQSPSLYARSAASKGE